MYHRLKRGRCPRCGHDLTGVAEDSTCPECGLDHPAVLSRRSKERAQEKYYQKYPELRKLAEKKRAETETP